MIIIALIVGAIAHKVVSGFQSIVVLLTWFEVWQSSATLLVGIMTTVCLAVAGQALYRRML